MADRTTKIILVILAAGLWINAATALIRPAMAQADPQFYNLVRVITQVADGQCQNRKLC